MNNTDAILILGHRLNPDNTPSDQLKSRIDTAVAYWRETDAPVIMPCGGITRDRSRSEADVMREMLVERGVPAEIIHMEDKSRTTTENIVNAVKLLKPGARVALVTSEYHVDHALFECERFGINAYGVPAPTYDNEERRRGYEMCNGIMQFEKDCIAKGLVPEEHMHDFFMRMRNKLDREGIEVHDLPKVDKTDTEQ